MLIVKLNSCENIELEIFKDDIDNSVVTYYENEVSLQEFAIELFNTLKICNVNSFFSRTYEYVDVSELTLNEAINHDAESDIIFYCGYDCLIINYLGDEVFAYHCNYSNGEDLERELVNLLQSVKIEYDLIKE